MFAICFFAFEMMAVVFSVKFAKAKWLPIIMFTIGILVCVGCNKTNDVLALERRYWKNQFDDFPIGFRIIMNIFIDKGKSFFFFKAVYAVVCLSAMYLFYKKQTEYVGMACAMFFVFPFNSFYGQIRNGMGATIAMIAMCWYIKSDMKRKTLVYIGIILIASLIHPSIVMYLLVIFSVLRIEYKGYVLAAFLAIICVTVGFMSGMGKLLVSVFVDSERVLRWLDFSFSTNLMGSFLVVVGQIAGTLLVVYARNRLQYIKAKGENNTGTFSLYQADILVRIHLFFLALIPFYFMTHNYFRVFKYLLIVDWLLFTQVIWLKGKKNNLMLLLTWGYIGALYVGQIIVEGGLEKAMSFLNSFDINNLIQIF